MLNSEEIKNGQEVIKTPEEAKDKDLETVKAEIKSEGEAKSKEVINNINEAADVALESFSDNPELKGDVSKIVSGANNEISSLTEDFENKLGKQNLSSREELLKLSKEDIIQIGSKSVQEMLDQIPDADSEVASKIIDDGLGSFVARNLDKFHNLSEEIITKLMEDKDSREVVYMNTDKLGENAKTILLKLSKEDIIQIGSKSVQEMLDQIPDADSEVASKIIDDGLGSFVARNLDKFHNLSEEIITKLKNLED